jgi:hypothetical protein
MGKPSYKGEFGTISVAENDESEFKIGFVFRAEIDDPKRFWQLRDEARIADVSKEIWYAYRAHRYAYEARSNAVPEQLILADSSRRPSYHAEQGKERRLRSFFVMSNEHPRNLEIRGEDLDGKRILMLKKGNGAQPPSYVIRRKEIKLTADVRETPEAMLRLLPDHYKGELELEFNKKSRIFNPLQTNSQRLKTKVRLLETERGPLEFHIEMAHDLGAGLTIDGLRWPIREYEAEVKGIYRPGEKIDLKEHPEVIGLDEDDIGKMCVSVLAVEQADFMEFSMLYLLSKAREEPERYGDIEVQPISYSKSYPGRMLLEDVISAGKKALHQLCYDKKGVARQFDWNFSAK